MNDKLLRNFKIIGIAEGISFLLLLGIAMPLKYMAGIPQAVSVVGMLHGILFLAYLYLLYECWQTYKWPAGTALKGAFASVLPFGPFIFDKQIKKPQ